MSDAQLLALMNMLHDWQQPQPTFLDEHWSNNFKTNSLDQLPSPRHARNSNILQGKKTSFQQSPPSSVRQLRKANGIILMDPISGATLSNINANSLLNYVQNNININNISNININSIGSICSNQINSINIGNSQSNNGGNTETKPNIQNQLGNAACSCANAPILGCVNLPTSASNNDDDVQSTIQQMFNMAIQLLFLNAAGGSGNGIDTLSSLYAIADSFNHLMVQLHINLQMIIITGATTTTTHTNTIATMTTKTTLASSATTTTTLASSASTMASTTQTTTSTTTAFNFTIEQARAYFELVVEQEYLQCLKSKYPDYNFEMMGYGSTVGITKREPPYNNLLSEGVDISTNATGVYTIDRVQVYVWFNGKNTTLQYTLVEDPSGSTNYHTCGRCSRQLQCCKYKNVI